MTAQRQRLPLLLLAAGLGAALGCAQRPAETPAETPRQVILLLLDAARPDRFSAYGYPRATTPEIDRLAARGVVFHRHYAQGTGTLESIPSLLYSRYYSVPLFPNDPNVPYSKPGDLFRRPDEAQISLPRAFQRAGFKTAAISAHLWTGEDTAFAAEFEEMHDLTRRYGSQKYPYPRAREVIDFAIEWIAENRSEDYFLYIHLMDTHFPHYFEDEAQELFGASAYAARSFGDNGAPSVPVSQLTADDRRYVDALYDGSLRYADRHIGRLFDALEVAGRLDDAVIAITSDHGEYLLDSAAGEPPAGRSVFSHGGPWREPVARVPLVLHHPQKLAPAHFHGQSEGVDIAPTLLALAGAAVPPGKSLDGIDLAPVLAGEAEPKAQSLSRGAIRTATHKCLFTTADRRLLGPEAPPVAEIKGRLYDLAADPAEAADLFRRQPELVAELLGRYRRVLRQPYRRSESARTTETPRSAFAISARHVRPEVPLPRVEGGRVPAGWSRLVAEPHSALIARGTDQSLSLRVRIPDGRYQHFLGMAGRATVEVDGERRELTSTQGMVPFGEIEVRDETFRATIVPRPDQPLRIFFFGFVPPGAGPEDGDDRTRRLKALGYIQ